MPRRNGMGPWNMGPATGRGFGPCARGYGFRGASGWGPGFRGAGCYVPSATRKELLQEHKEMLKEQLSWVNDELGREKDD